jgi:hypothetical protein
LWLIPLLIPLLGAMLLDMLSDGFIVFAGFDLSAGFISFLDMLPLDMVLVEPLLMLLCAKAAGPSKVRAQIAVGKKRNIGKLLL